MAALYIRMPDGTLNRLSDGAFVPADPRNCDAQQAAADIAADPTCVSNYVAPVPPAAERSRHRDRHGHINGRHRPGHRRVRGWLAGCIRQEDQGRGRRGKGSESMSWKVDKDRVMSWATGVLMTILLTVMAWMGERIQAQTDTNTTDISLMKSSAGVDHEAINEIRERSKIIEQDVKELLKARP